MKPIAKFEDLVRSRTAPSSRILLTRPSSQRWLGGLAGSLALHAAVIVLFSATLFMPSRRPALPITYIYVVPRLGIDGKAGAVSTERPGTSANPMFHVKHSESFVAKTRSRVSPPSRLEQKGMSAHHSRPVIRRRIRKTWPAPKEAQAGEGNLAASSGRDQTVPLSPMFHVKHPSSLASKRTSPAASLRPGRASAATASDATKAAGGYSGIRGNLGGRGQVARIPQMLSGPLPIYPENARRDQLEGEVVLRVIVDQEGAVEPAIEIIESMPVFNQAAIDAVRQWRFSPARDRDGKCVPASIEIPLRFTLNQAS